MKNTNILKERRELKRAAGILNEAMPRSGKRAFQQDIQSDPDYIALIKTNADRRHADSTEYKGDTGQTPHAIDRDYYVDKFVDPEKYIDTDDEDDLEEDFDYDMGTPSGDTDNMNIAEDLKERKALMKAAGLLKEDDLDLPDESPFEKKADLASRLASMMYNDAVENGYLDFGGYWENLVDGVIPSDIENLMNDMSEEDIEQAKLLLQAKMEDGGLEEDFDLPDKSPFEGPSKTFKLGMCNFLDSVINYIGNLKAQGDFKDVGVENPASNLLYWIHSLGDSVRKYFPDDYDRALFDDVWEDHTINIGEERAAKLVTIEDLLNYLEQVKNTYR